jgi:5-methylthioadenosine/S-adenosylhomocysteine deaminase
VSDQLLIEDTTVVTMNEDRDILSHASVAIEGSHFAAVGPSAALRTAFPEAIRISGRGKVLLPGLINCHTHVSMSLQKGVTVSVEDGIYRVMWPVERSLTAEDCYVGALAGAAEALLGGTTCIVDHYFHMEEVARATLELGIRGVLGHTIMSRLGPYVGREQFEEGIAFVHRWKDRNPLVIPWLAPHGSDTVSTAWLRELRGVASEVGAGLHLHLAQSRVEVDYIREQHGVGCVRYLYDLGFLGDDVLAAHCMYVDEDEIELLFESGTHPVYCPMGHALGGHPMRAWELMERGVKVVLGTDCVCANNVMDIVGELRIAGASQRQLTGSTAAMPAMRILEMVTVDAAQAIGMSGRLGTIAKGFVADLVMLDFDGLSTAPNYSLLNNIVYCCNGGHVNTVVVGGRVVVQDHALLAMSERELVQRLEESGRSLMKRALKSDDGLSWLWRSSYGKEPE